MSNITDKEIVKMADEFVSKIHNDYDNCSRQQIAFNGFIAGYKATIQNNKVSDVNYHSIVCKEHEWIEVELTTTNDNKSLYSIVCRKCGISKVSDASAEEFLEKNDVNIDRWPDTKALILKSMQEYASMVSDKTAFEKECNKLKEKIDNASIVNENLLQELGEKEVMIKAFADIQDMFENRYWIMEGRGCYPYDDDRYKEEMRYLYDDFCKLKKDVWKNIKTKTFEYRDKIIANYKKSIVNERKDNVGSLVDAGNLIRWCEEQKSNIHTAAEELGYNDEIIQQHYNQFIKYIQLESQPQQKEV